jgi:hypothetical protein
MAMYLTNTSPNKIFCTALECLIKAHEDIEG